MKIVTFSGHVALLRDIVCLSQLLHTFYSRSSEGSIELIAFDEEQKLKKLRDMEELERVGYYKWNTPTSKTWNLLQIDTDADNISELLYDEASAKSEVTLFVSLSRLSDVVQSEFPNTDFRAILDRCVRFISRLIIGCWHRHQWTIRLGYGVWRRRRVWWCIA